MNDPFVGRRLKMVERYVAGRGVTDERVLEVMRQVPRHMFLESALAQRAYDDYAAPIGSGQTMSQPYTVGLLAQFAKLSGDEKILEIGTGSGYQSAVLSLLADHVYTVERFNTFSNQARKIFNRLHYKNIVCLVGDGAVRSARYAPFDVIVVTAGAPQIPKALALQLADGGRMVVPVGDGKEQTLMIARREANRFIVTRKEQCSFVPLIGQDGWMSKSG